MEFDYFSPSETFVVLTADQFVARDDCFIAELRWPKGPPSGAL